MHAFFDRAIRESYGDKNKMKESFLIKRKKIHRKKEDQSVIA